MTPTTPKGWYSSHAAWFAAMSPEDTLCGPRSLAAFFDAQSMWSIGEQDLQQGVVVGLAVLPVHEVGELVRAPGEEALPGLQVVACARRTPARSHHTAASFARATAACHRGLVLNRPGAHDVTGRGVQGVEGVRGPGGGSRRRRSGRARSSASCPAALGGPGGLRHAARRRPSWDAAGRRRRRPGRWTRLEEARGGTDGSSAAGGRTPSTWSWWGRAAPGCVIASRLTEDPDVSVLLLEAGGRRQRTTRSPSRRRSPSSSAPSSTGPTRRRSRSTRWGGRMAWPRGKSLGGSVVDERDDLYPRQPRGLRRVGGADRRRLLGLRVGPAAVPPLARTTPAAESRYHGVGGPLHVNEQRSTHAWSHAFVEACLQVGARRPATTSTARRQDGAGLYQVTQHKGKRWSAAKAFLHPAMDRPNLTVRTGALSTRLAARGRPGRGRPSTTGRASGTSPGRSTRWCSAAGRSTPRSC